MISKSEILGFLYCFLYPGADAFFLTINEYIMNDKNRYPKYLRYKHCLNFAQIKSLIMISKYRFEIYIQKNL